MSLNEFKKMYILAKSFQPASVEVSMEVDADKRRISLGLNSVLKTLGKTFHRNFGWYESGRRD